MRKIVKNTIFSHVLLLSFLMSQNSFASYVSKENGLFLGADGRWAWTHADTNTNVPNGSTAQPPYNADLYNIDSRHSRGSFSLYGGYRFAVVNKNVPDFKLALRYQHLGNFKINGMIEQYSQPKFTNYNYNLHLSSNAITLQGTFDLYHFDAFSPYISAGIGLSFNRLASYNEQAVPQVIPRISPQFQTRTTHDVTYNLGLGINYQINHRAWTSLGYEYADLGKAKTNKGVGANWTKESLSLGNLKAHSLVLGIFYQFT